MFFVRQQYENPGNSEIDISPIYGLHRVTIYVSGLFVTSYGRVIICRHNVHNQQGGSVREERSRLVGAKGTRQIVLKAP